MQRTERKLETSEIIEVLDEIINIIIEAYNKPLRDLFKNETRATQIGVDIEGKLLRRKIIEIHSDIGWKSQQYLLKKDVIKPGGIKEE